MSRTSSIQIRWMQASKLLLGASTTLLVAATAAFIMLKIAPGDPVDVLLGPLAQIDFETRATIRTDLGLDQPLIVQYLGHIGRLAVGNFGYSYQLRKPVLQVIVENTGPTLLLTFCATILAVIVTWFVVRGVTSRLGKAFVNTLSHLAVVSPVFWTGGIFAAIFSYQLGWFPIAGGNWWQQLILPTITLAIPLTGMMLQMLSDSLTDHNNAAFVLSVRARGASEKWLTRNHLLRHAGANLVTFTAYLFGSLLGGAVIVETLFSRAGLGRVALDAVLGRDLPVIMGMIVLLTAVYILLSALVEIIIRLIDPRLKA